MSTPTRRRAAPRTAPPSPFDLHANFSYSTLAAAASASVTALVIHPGDGSLFPAAPFNVTIWPADTNPLAGNAEIVRVTSKGSGENWTVLRGQEGTTALALSLGSQVGAAISVKTLTDLEQAVTADGVRLDGHDTALTSADGRLTTVEAGVADADSRLDGHDSAIATADSRLDGHDSAISTADTRLDGHDSALTTADSRLDGDDTELANLNSRLTVIEAELPGIQTMAQSTRVLFDQVLAATGPSIDTGPGAIPPGFASIEVLITAATDFPAVAVTTTAGGIQVNGDAGSNYFYESLLDSNGTYGGSNNQTTPDAGVLRINMPGATAGAGSVCMARCVFHNYDSTRFNKIGLLEHSMFDPVTAANGRTRVTAAYWKNTAAITRLALLMKSNNLLAGSRMTVIGHSHS
jgi:hypothetical protein